MRLANLASISKHHKAPKLRRRFKRTEKRKRRYRGKMNIHAVPSVYQKTRCILTAGSIETGQSQAKRRPVAGFRSKEFIHRVTPAIIIFNRAFSYERQVDVISPDSWSAALEQMVQRTPAQFYRVKATLGQVFEKTFFLEHVKTGKRRHTYQEIMLTLRRKHIHAFGRESHHRQHILTPQRYQGRDQHTPPESNI